MTFKSYPKVHALGSKGYEQIFELPVIIQEKLDGSNVSIHKINGELRIASRTRWLGMQSPEDAGMFKLFSAWVHQNADRFDGLKEGDALWGEFCNNHNVLKYETKLPFVLFDISETDQFGNRIFIPQNRWYERVMRLINAGTLVYIQGFVYEKFPGVDELQKFLEIPSMLGGKREGVVIKNYTHKNHFGADLFCKYVNAEFKEKHKEKEVKDKRDPIEVQVAQEFFNEARMRKAIQRLREEGRLACEPKDIGELIGIVCKDIHDEEQEEIKQKLFEHHWKQIARVIAPKIPPMYKDMLAKGEVK